MVHSSADVISVRQAILRPTDSSACSCPKRPCAVRPGSHSAALPCSYSHCLPPARRALLQPATRAQLPCPARAALPCSPRPAALQPVHRAALPLGPRAALPCSSQAALPCPAAQRVAPCCPASCTLLSCTARALLCCTARALLPSPPRALLPNPPRALPCTPRRALPCPATPPSPSSPAQPEPHRPTSITSPSRPAATTAASSAVSGGGAGSAAGAGGVGGAAGAGGAGPTTDRHYLSWPLSRQSQWLGVDSGGHCLSRTTPPLSSFASGFFSEPVQAAALGASECAAALCASESTAALGASESATALGASESAAAPDASDSATTLGTRASPAIGPSSAEALHTFTLDSGASRCFFRDCTALTPLAASVPVSLADHTGGPVVARASTVLPCTALPSSSLSGLHLPTFLANLVSNAVIQDVWADTFIPRGQGVAICTCSRTCRHLAMSLPSLPRSPAPSCLPCVKGRQRVAAHSSEFPPTSAPLQTLHMDVWGPAPVYGTDQERYFLLVVDDYTCYTTVFPLQCKADVSSVLIPWIRATRRQLCERFSQDFPVLRLYSGRSGEFSSGLLRHIGLIMEVSRTSMIHAAAPHFLWPFAVRYTAYQLNLWPRVSKSETSPTLRWTGKVGDASVFRVSGALSLVCNVKASKLSSRTHRCTHPPWLILWRSLLTPLAELRGVTSPLTTRRPLTALHTWRPPLVFRLGRLRHLRSLLLWTPELRMLGAETEGAGSGGAASGGAGSTGAATGGAGSWGAATRGADSGGTAGAGGNGGTAGGAGGAAGAGGTSGAAGAGGAEATSPRGATGSRGAGPTSPRGTAGARGAGGATGAGGAGAGGTGGTGAAGPGGARTGGAGAAGSSGAVCVGGAIGAAGSVGARGTAGAGGAGAGGTGGTRGAGAAGPGGAHTRGVGAAGAGGIAGAGGAGAGGTGGAGAAGPGGARTRGAGGARAVGAAGAGGAGGAGGATGAAGTGGVGGITGAEGAGARGTGGPGAAGAGGAGATGAGGAGAAGSAPRRPFFYPQPQSSLPLPDSLLPGSSLPAPAPYTEVTESLTERREPEICASTPVRARHVARPCPPAVLGTHGMALRPSSIPHRVVLHEPPASSLPHVPDPESDLACAASPTITRLLATIVTDPDLDSTTAFALVTKLVDFAARIRLNYVASLVTESESICPPSVGGEPALSSDVLEDRQFELECLAAALPRLTSMLLCTEGDPDALDIPTLRSYAEAIASEYFQMFFQKLLVNFMSWSLIIAAGIPCSRTTAAMNRRAVSLAEIDFLLTAK
ncbi:unnamed protein product [Closterium sp. NIES-53]